MNDQGSSPSSPTRGPDSDTGDRDQRIERLCRELEGLAAALQATNATVQSLASTMENVLDHLGELQNDHDRLKDGLREKTESQERHLASLQESHDQLKEKVWADGDGIVELRKRWRDAEREISTLAEALSRTGRD